MTTTTQDHSVDESKQQEQADSHEQESPQEKLWQLYQQQQARLACPGCGEASFLG